MPSWRPAAFAFFGLLRLTTTGSSSPERTGPFQPYPAKFDLSTLPDKTVSYFISDQPPGKLVDGDNYDALVSQIRLAAETWNGVTTSDIRLRFGGFSTIGATPQATPGIDVVFDDNMPPGLLAQTMPSLPDGCGRSDQRPRLRADPALQAAVAQRSDRQAAGQLFGSFLPDHGARVRAHPGLAAFHGFGDHVHFDHARHHQGAAAVGGRYRRNLDALPHGGVRGLHGQHHRPGSVKRERGEHGERGGAFLERDGDRDADQSRRQLSYRWHSARAIITCTRSRCLRRSRTRRTPAAIVPPSDSHGGSFAAFTGFAGQFFPHTRDWTQAATTTVNAGASAAERQLRRGPARAAPRVYDMNILAYLGPSGKEAYVHAPSLVSGFRGWMVFNAPGTLVRNTPTLTPGLSVSTIGPAAQHGTGSTSATSSPDISIRLWTPIR